MYNIIKSSTISAQNTFTDALSVNKGESVALSIEMSGSPAFSGTAHLQRSLDAGTSWKDYKSFTADAELTIVDIECNMLLRAGVKTGNYSSGSVVIVLKVERDTVC